MTMMEDGGDDEKSSNNNKNDDERSRRSSNNKKTIQSESLDSAGHAGSGAIGFNGNGNISG